MKGDYRPDLSELPDDEPMKKPQTQTPIERLTAVLERNQHGDDTNQWFGFSTEFFIRLKEAVSKQWTLNQGEIARMAEDSESDANAKAGDGEYQIGKRV